MMIDLDMDAAAAPLDLSLAPWEIITIILQHLSYKCRFTCALVCKDWAKAAAAATSDVKILLPSLQTSKCLQQWVEKHGDQIKSLQLHSYGGAALTALPCAQLQDLLLHGSQRGTKVEIGSRVWRDIAAATKLTSVSLSGVDTASQQADLVLALTALPDLEQLTWHDVRCSGKPQLSDSLLLQQLTQLTRLDVQYVSAAALEHLGSLTKLQYLGVGAAADWAAAGCPGLGELKTLTSLGLWIVEKDLPASVYQLTALQRLEVLYATPTALHSLQALTGLTYLRVGELVGPSLDTPPLQLPGLQHLVLQLGVPAPLRRSFLATCTQLQVLELSDVNLSGPGSLVASTMLQGLALDSCRLTAAAGVAGGPVSWQQVFPGPGRLPHLTSLRLTHEQPDLQQVDIERMLACCSSLQGLHLETMQESFVSALAQLSGLTRLKLEVAGDEQCDAVAQLTGLQDLTVHGPHAVSAAGLRQLAALKQLTSLGFVYNCSRKVSHVLQAQMSDRLLDHAHAIINQVRVGGKGEQLAVCYSSTV